MSLNSAAVDLSNAFKTLTQAWEEAQEVWDDQVRREFAEQQWNPLEERTRLVLQAMDRLGPILDHAIRECS